MSRKRRRKPAAPQSKKPSQPPAWNRWGRAAVTASGWIAALFVGFLDLPAKVNSFFAEAPKTVRNVGDAWMIDKRFTGTWTSDHEGILGLSDEHYSLSRFEGEPVIMRINVYGGKVEGEINSAGLGKHYLFSRLMLGGTVSGGVLHGVVTDYIDNKLVAIAKFDLVPDDGELRLTAVEQGMPFLPKKAILRQDDSAMPDDLGRMNVDFVARALAKRRTTAPQPEQ